MHLCMLAPYGYKKSRTVKNKLIIDEEAAEVVRRIFALAGEGYALAKIARILNGDKVLAPLMYRRKNDTDKGRGWNVAGNENFWTGQNIKRIIEDERFTGKMVACKLESAGIGSKKIRKTPRSQWILTPDTHEPVVSQKEYDRAQLVIKKCHEPYKIGAKGLFASKIMCGHCGIF